MNRHERYSRRSGGEYVDENNPIPGWIDPITLEPCANPAISPYGHVMGMATWKVSLPPPPPLPHQVILVLQKILSGISFADLLRGSSNPSRQNGMLVSGGTM